MIGWPQHGASGGMLYTQQVPDAHVANILSSQFSASSALINSFFLRNQLFAFHHENYNTRNFFAQYLLLAKSTLTFVVRFC